MKLKSKQTRKDKKTKREKKEYLATDEGFVKGS
jgi:hypothetical protein